MAQAFNPGTCEAEEAGDLWEFEASLSYILSSRAAIALCRAILLLCTCTYHHHHHHHKKKKA